MARGTDTRWDPSRRPDNYGQWQSGWGGKEQVSYNDHDPAYPDTIRTYERSSGGHVATFHSSEVHRDGEDYGQDFQAGPFKTQGRAMVAAGALANRAQGQRNPATNPKLARYSVNRHNRMF